MRNAAATLLVSLAALVGLAGCSSGISAEDAYQIACPAGDTAAGSGSVVNKATVAGLKQLSESGVLDARPQRWLDATIACSSPTPQQGLTEAKQLIIDGCAKNATRCGTSSRGSLRGGALRWAPSNPSSSSAFVCSPAGTRFRHLRSTAPTGAHRRFRPAVGVAAGRSGCPPAAGPDLTRVTGLGSPTRTRGRAVGGATEPKMLESLARPSDGPHTAPQGSAAPPTVRPRVSTTPEVPARSRPRGRRGGRGPRINRVHPVVPGNFSRWRAGRSSSRR